MIKQEDEYYMPSRSPLINLSHMTHSQKDRQKRSVKVEPSENGRERKRKVDQTPPSSASLFASTLMEFKECSKCPRARSTGLDAWMEHLGLCHTFPARWPSSRLSDGLLDREHPYTSVVDSHKKRKSSGIPRPLNSFMIFAQYIRRLTLLSFPDAPNVHISQQVGKLWRNLSNDYREIYANESRRLQDLHTLEFPDYKYQPRRRLRDEEAEPSYTPPIHSSNPNPPPAMHSVHPQPYFETYSNNAKSHQIPPKNPLPSTPQAKLDPFNVSAELSSSFCNFPSLSNHSPVSTDTLTSLQTMDPYRESYHHQDDGVYYNGPFSYASTSTDRLSWTEDRMITEPVGQSCVTPAPVATSADEMFSQGDNWSNYHQSECTSKTESPPLPGIETWTFSGPTV